MYKEFLEIANVGAVLGLLDGPIGCDPAFSVVRFRFRLLRRYLALWPTGGWEGFYRLLEMVNEGSPWAWTYSLTRCWCC